MIRFQKYGWMIGSILIFLLIGFAEPGYPKTAKAKSSKDPRMQSARTSTALKGTRGSLQCDAQSALLMDGLTSQVLYDQNANLSIQPASFAKVLTLYVVLDAIRAGQVKMEDLVTISEKAWRMQGSKMFIKVGERVRVDDLLKGVAISSGNDACVALAEHIAGTEEVFVEKMNEKAKLIGMTASQFRNSHGMPAENQYTTAMDMVILAKHYLEDHPEAMALHSTTEFEYNGIRQGNRNTLLSRNIGVDGLKTGHVEKSGFHLLATAKRENQRLIAVVMGCDRIGKRGPEAEKLLEYGFKNFSTVEAVQKGASFGPVKVKRGKVGEMILVAAEAGRITVPKGKEGTISVITQLPPFVEAPIEKNKVLGKVLIQNEGKVIKEVPLLSSSDVLKSLLPPWPVIGAVLLGVVLVGSGGLWWMKRRKVRRF